MRLTGLIGVVVFSLTISCSTKEQKEETLARQYCGSCHAFTEPSLLTKDAWSTVLPQMAVRMGVDISPLLRLSEADYPHVIATLPKNPMISERDFEAIMNYYEREAPDSLAFPADDNPKQIDQFAITEHKVLDQRPTFCMLRADTVNKQFWLSNRSSMIYRTDYDFRVVDSIKVTSPASSIVLREDGPLVSLMGIMDPNDQPAGSITTLDHKTLIDSIKRPVFIEQADINNDQQDDLIVCAFGNYGGELIVYEFRGGYAEEAEDTRRSSPVKHVISSLPGARKVVVKDFNNDGLKDILVLFSQGDEQISLYTNAGNFRFRVTTLLKFQPVYGTAFFDITDFNKDGHWDIVTANGDNADFSMILKPYHGVRIFLNDGKDQFTESWFHPLPGASIALARDFDKDGDVDIAATAFFPDFRNHPEKGFVYFENNGGKLEPSVTPLAVDARWLLMETVDIDSDGYTDIVLAALDFDNGVPRDLQSRWHANPVDVLLLRNNGKK